MNIVKRLDQYNENYVYFCDPIKNNIMNEAKFIRILYSSPHFILNGIYLYIPLQDVVIEKYYNKYKCVFNIHDNRLLIEKLKVIEETILQKSNIKNKIPTFKIYEQMINGNIKIFNFFPPSSPPSTETNSFVIKISGIWETETNYGLTFKFSKLYERFVK